MIKTLNKVVYFNLRVLFAYLHSIASLVDLFAIDPKLQLLINSMLIHLLAFMELLYYFHIRRFHR